MPSRSGFIDQGGGFIGERPAQQMPPSLLQMAQGVAPAMGGGGGGNFGMMGQGGDLRGGGAPSGGGGPGPSSAFGAGGGWMPVPEPDNPNWNGLKGLQYRPITSPQDQNWSDLQGRPIHVGGGGAAPPAYNPGSSFGGYNAVFDPRAPSSTGGWFTMEDYLNQAPTAMQAAMNPGSMPAPQRAGKENALSTNNWRLLGNDPDVFMINGTIVNRRQMGRDLAPKSVLGLEGGTGHPGYRPTGGGTWAMPFGSQGAMQGYIGADNWATVSTPTY